MTRMGVGAALMLALALATGCNNSRQPREGEAGAALPTAGVTPAPGQPVKRVEVRLTDYRIEMPSQLDAGPTLFRVLNAGGVEHNFEVEGQGIEKEFESKLMPGETRNLEVDLKPGTYRVYCPVGNHAGRGMEMELAVR